MLKNILMAAMLVGAPPEKSANPPYRWLDTGELDTLLRGYRIVEADNRPSHLRTREEFHQNGNYVRYEHNYEAQGKYKFSQDAVCDHAIGEGEICRKILVDSMGQYWIIARNNSKIIIRISVTPIR